MLFHEIPHEISDFTMLYKSGYSLTKCILLQMVTAIGALLGCYTGISINLLHRTIYWRNFQSRMYRFYYRRTLILGHLRITRRRTTTKEWIHTDHHRVSWIHELGVDLHVCVCFNGMKNPLV
jgi:hypothetical protein